jgi:hypothetical protein
MIKISRYVLFRGNLLHGVLSANLTSVDDIISSNSRRITLLVNYWKKHKPLSPICDEPKPSLSYSLRSSMSSLFWNAEPNNIETNLSPTKNHKASEKEISDYFLRNPQSLSPHTLDLQVGLHSSVNVNVGIPSGKQNGAFLMEWNRYNEIHPEEIEKLYSKEQPFIELVCTVGNNEELLPSMLLSVRDIIDQYLIINQDSTDNSISIIKTLLIGIPGKIINNSQPMKESIIASSSRLQLVFHPRYLLMNPQATKAILIRNWENIKNVEKLEFSSENFVLNRKGEGSMIFPTREFGNALLDQTKTQLTKEEKEAWKILMKKWQMIFAKDEQDTLAISQVYKIAKIIGDPKLSNIMYKKLQFQ